MLKMKYEATNRANASMKHLMSFIITIPSAARLKVDAPYRLEPKMTKLNYNND